MGTMFSFVSNDVSSKIDILVEFRYHNKDADRFNTFHRLVNHEKESGLLAKSGYVSASRTLLRLHRGLGKHVNVSWLLCWYWWQLFYVLDFIREFLNDLERLGPNDKTVSCCQTAYNRTLANFHPWIVRKGAVVAMYAMPTRDQLLNRVCLDISAAIECLPQMLAVTDQVYKRTEDIYTLHDLHTLPWSSCNINRNYIIIIADYKIVIIWIISIV